MYFNVLLVHEKNSSNKAVLHFEKIFVDKNDVRGILHQINKIETLFKNDCYRRISGKLGSSGQFDGTFICPAEDKVIQRYTSCKFKLILETYSMYKSISLPYIKCQLRNEKWLSNLLEGKAEQSRVLLNAAEFLIVSDLKWDENDFSAIHLLAIKKSKDLLCLRQLNSSHLNFLTDIKRDASEIMFSKFGIVSQNIILFVNYLPTFDHFHVHITLPGALQSEITIGKSVLLDDIIENIKSDSNYYQKCVLNILVPENTEIHKEFEKTLAAKK